MKDIEKYLMDLSMEKKIVLKESEEGLRVYVSHFYYLELNTAKMLHDLNLEYEEAECSDRKKDHQIEKEAEMQLDEKQENAVDGGCTEWNYDSHRRSWNRKNDDDQCHDRIFSQ